MYPDLSYFLHDLFGTPADNWTSIFKTFGGILMLAFLASAYFLYLELKRKEKEGLIHPVESQVTIGKPASIFELIMSGIVGFLIGFKLLYVYYHFPEFKADAVAVIFSSKGVLLGGIIGAIINTAWAFWEKHSRKLAEPKLEKVIVHPYERIGDITTVAAISGIIGAKVFAIIEDLDAFFADPFGVFFSGSGMAIYGGLIAGFVIGGLFVKRIGIPPIHVLDAVAPALFVGTGIGRLGCQFAGDGCWGVVNNMAQPSWWFLPDWMWSYTYPHNYVNDGIPIPDCTFIHCRQLAEGVWPTPIYEFIVLMSLAAILWAFRKRITKPGIMFSIYLILNGLERFWIESIRVNNRYDILGFQSTQAEVIAIGLFLLGIIGLVFFGRKTKL